MTAQPEFDQSKDYRKHPTFAPLPAWLLEEIGYLRCPGCGGIHFVLRGNDHQPVCLNCGYRPVQNQKPDAVVPANWGQLVHATVKVGSHAQQDTFGNTVVLYPNGTVRSLIDHAIHSYSDQSIYVGEWENIIAIAGNRYNILGLSADGTVNSIIYDYPDNDYDRERFTSAAVEDWTNVIAVATTDRRTVGLRADGTILDTIDSSRNYCPWTDVTAIATLFDYAVALCADGSVRISDDASNTLVKMLQEITGVTAIASGGKHLLLLCNDGTVKAIGNNTQGQCEVRFWSDIKAIAAGSGHSVLLRSDGTVKAVGSNSSGQCNVSGWTDVIAVMAQRDYTAALRADGTILCTDSTVLEILEEVYR